MIFIAQQKLGYPLFFLAGILTLGFIASLENSFLQIMLLLGMGLGITLNYFAFGFASAWRNLLISRRSSGIRAQLVMLLVASTLFAPLILLGELGDTSYQALVRPAGFSVVLGAFIFGVGMQLAGSCSSGTFNRVGRLEPLSFLALTFLLVGGVVGSYFYGEWVTWPVIASFSFVVEWGVAGWLLSMAVLLLFYRWFVSLEKNKHGDVAPLITRYDSGAGKKIKWVSPWLMAGVVLAVLNFLVFYLSGQPWSISSVFTLWGLKASEVLSLNIDWSFWEVMSLYEQRMDTSVLEDVVSLTTIGVILGALLVTLAQGKLASERKTSFNGVGLSIVGGFLMGFGATLSYGCNIGAFFSGIASGSLHGWLWIVFAVIGNVVALKALKRV